MKASQPCDLCGCTEVNLHDGFYFCMECGTQDTNFQETIVERIERGTGGLFHGQKKKLLKIVEEEKEMSDAWYKWHAFNFLLKGVADELLEYGANESFKTKLMWVWIRYIKKYLKQDEMGFNENPHKLIMPDEDEKSDSDEDRPPEDLLTIWDVARDRVIKSFSFTLLITLLYIALNLDKSKMTLTHLVKLMRDGLLSVPNRIHNIIPKEMKPEKLVISIKKGMSNFKPSRIRIVAMTLFKRLDLGNPIVPDLRNIIDTYLKELCLPTDLKPLVLSLMHYKPCNFLDVNVKDKIIYKVPAYEFHVMTYIIWALKLCLGLDCDYEIKLSAAAEAINENEDRPKSYYINGESAPTDRLFSFREWITFYQFRQVLLRHYCYRYANKCSWDTDDYIALEHHVDLLQNVYGKDLKDEMTYDLLHRIKGGEVQSFVIPKSEFKPTLTPFHSYTQVVAQHLQDPEVKLKLTEDFSQYSLKYVIEDWNLVNPNSRKKKNLVKGIRKGNKIVTNKLEQFHKKEKIYSKKMVYVRNCENHNWLSTKPPTLEHVVRVDKLHPSNDDQDPSTQNGVDMTNNNNSLEQRIEDEVDSKSHSVSEISTSTISSSLKFVDETRILESNKLDVTEKNYDNNLKFPDIVSDHSFTDSTLSNSIRFIDETKVYESNKLGESEKKKLREMHDKIANPNEISEEAEGVNIFDDDFKPLIKEELVEHDDCEMNYENSINVTENFQNISIVNNQTGNGNDDNDSVVSSIDSLNFNEATFDRAKVIKEIILYTCKKHNLPIPPEYNPKVVNRKEMGLFSRKTDCLQYKYMNNRKRSLKYEMLGRNVWQQYVTDYHAALQDDVLNQIAQKVNLAIQNADSAQQVNEDPPLDDTVPDADTNADNNMDVDVDVVSNHSATNINGTNHTSDTRSRIRYESDEDKLFSEESDGETHAKELLPEKHPDFDEEVYDASQLYLKAAKTAEEGEMELDPQLSGIIDKKMVKDAKDPSLLSWTEERKKLARPDSEDEMTLSVLQELKELTKKLSKQNDENLEPFVDKKVENFKYWFRFYTGVGSSTTVLRRIFEKEVSNNMPKSLMFILKQCAHILGVSEGELYKNLQKFETTAVEKLKYRLKGGRVDKSDDF